MCLSLLILKLNVLFLSQLMIRMCVVPQPQPLESALLGPAELPQSTEEPHCPAEQPQQSAETAVSSVHSGYHLSKLEMPQL